MFAPDRATPLVSFESAAPPVHPGKDELRPAFFDAQEFRLIHHR